MITVTQDFGGCHAAVMRRAYDGGMTETRKTEQGALDGLLRAVLFAAAVTGAFVALMLVVRATLPL